MAKLKMLELLQSLSLIAAFFLPWMIGMSVSFYKNGKRDKLAITVTVAAVCVLIIVLALFIAFSVSGEIPSTDV